MTTDIKYPTNGTTTLERLRTENPVNVDGDDKETTADWWKRVEPKVQTISRSDAKDRLMYAMAVDKANQRGVPLLILADSSVDSANAVVLTREQARIAQNYRKAMAESEATGKPIVVVD